MELIDMADFVTVRDKLVEDLNTDRMLLAFWPKRADPVSEWRRERMKKDVADAEKLVAEGESTFDPELPILDYDNYAEVVRLRLAERMSWNEVARELGLNPWHMRIHYENARKFFDYLCGRNDEWGEEHAYET